LHEALRVAATSRRDYEPHDVTDDEAAVQADAIERRLTSIDEALGRIDFGRLRHMPRVWIGNCG
jgi:hypothetical protein